MKKFGKLAAIVASAAIATTMGVTLSACGGSEQDYSFEAENAIITDGGYDAPVYDASWQPTGETAWTDVDVAYETANEYGTGDEVTCMGYFYGSSKLTWKITSNKECDATLKFRASSCSVLTLSSTWTQEDWAKFDWTDWSPFYTYVGIDPVEFTEDSQPVTLTVNGTEVNLIGELPGVDADATKVIENAYYYFGTVDATIHLKKGENVIVITGPEDGTSVCNPDKIIITTDAKLTWEPTNNADREQ